MRPLPVATWLLLAGACTPTGEGSTGNLLSGLDEAFGEGDADAFLAHFDPENDQLYEVLGARLRAALGGGERLHRRSEILALSSVDDREVALVRSLTRRADSPSGGGLEEHAYLVTKREWTRRVATLMVEVDRGLLSGTVSSGFRCPACNYEVAGAGGWLAVPHGRTRTGCMEAISFYLLGADLSLDVSVFVDEPMEAGAALAAYLESASGSEDVEVSPWIPPAHRADPPPGLSGAVADLQLPGRQPTRHHLVTLGGLRYLLVLRGDDPQSDRAREIVGTFRVLDPGAPPAMLAERPVRVHSGGSRFDGRTFVNPTYDVAFTGPEGWEHALGAAGCLFEVTFRCPEGRGKLWVTAYGPQPGQDSWRRAIADSWLGDYCRRSGMVIVRDDAWRDPDAGFEVRNLEASVPRNSPAATRKIRLAMADDLLLVLQGYGTGSEDRELIDRCFETVVRTR